MVGRKGFIHVVEAVIIAVVAIAMIPSMLHSVSLEEKWTRINLERMGRDILTALRKNDRLENIMSYNRTETGKLLEGVLGTKSNFIHYSLRTENAYRNSIRVGFNCTGCNVSEEKTRIRNILKPVWLNGRFVNFNLIPFDWRNFTGKLKNYDVHVIFLRGEEQVNLAETYWGTGKISNHTGRGRGIVEYVNLENGEINNDLQKKIFGLKESPQDSTNKLVFRNRENSAKRNYEPSKLFYGVASTVHVSGVGDTKFGNWSLGHDEYEVNISDDNSDGKYSEEDVCISGASPECNFEGDDFSLEGHDFTVEKIKKMKGGGFAGDVLIWFRHNQLYEFDNFVNGGNDGDITAGKESNIILETSDENEAGFVVNESKGRTAWISKGEGQDVKALAQTGVIWSAGKGWWNFLRSPQSGAIRAREFVVNDQEIYEPYEVILTLWYVY